MSLIARERKRESVQRTHSTYLHIAVPVVQKSEKIYNLETRVSLNIKSPGGKFDNNVEIFTWLEGRDHSSPAPPPPGAER